MICSTIEIQAQVSLDSIDSQTHHPVFLFDFTFNTGCTKWGNKTSSAPIDRQSPFFTHAYTYEYNSNTGEAPANEFPGAGIGPDDFHCERALGSWSDLFILNNGWLVGLTDIDTSKDNVRERQAAYIVEMVSMGISGFRIDAGKLLLITNP